MVGGTLITMLATLLPTIWGGMTGMHFVREGERGIRLRFNKVRRDKEGNCKVVYPGFSFLLPFVDSLAKISVQQRPLTMTTPPDDGVALKDGTVFGISAIVLCEVIDTQDDIYNAQFKTTNLDAAILAYCSDAVRKVLETKLWNELIGNQSQISESVLTELEPKVLELGVRIIKFGIISCKPSPETERLLQTVTRMNIMRQAIQTQGWNAHQHSALLGAAALGGNPFLSLPEMQGTGLGNGHTGYNGNAPSYETGDNTVPAKVVDFSALSHGHTNGNGNGKHNGHHHR